MIDRTGVFKTSRVKILAIILSLLSTGFLVVSYFVYQDRSGSSHSFWRRERLSSIQPETGFNYIAPTKHPELSSHERPSIARVLENSILLSGPANALHDDIRKIGKGRFSFWHDSVYFSASDNSDPRINGRLYEISFPVPIGRTFAWILYGAAGFFSFISVFFLMQVPILRRTGHSFLVYLKKHCRLKLWVPVFLFLSMICFAVNFFGTDHLAYIISSTLRKNEVPFELLAQVRKGRTLNTEQYIQMFEPARYEMLGADYCNPRYQHSRPGITDPNTNSPNFIYDFEKLRAVEHLLSGVDRKRALRAIFASVTAGTNTNTEKHLALLRFLQKSSYHNTYWTPFYPNKTSVTDPLVLLELGEMMCGHVSRLAVDLWATTGNQARIVQLGGHHIAELYYDGKWHFFDADLFKNGQTVLDTDGNIPSLVELSQPSERFKVDALLEFGDILYRKEAPGFHLSTRYASYYYFSKAAYIPYPPQYYLKTANFPQESNFMYGWDYYQTIEDKERILYDGPVFYQPSRSDFEVVRLDKDKGTLHVEYIPSLDRDGDLLGYRTYVSNKSRGWDDSFFWGSQSAKKYWSNPDGWKPAMYEKMAQIPPHEVALIETKDTSIDIPVEAGKTYFLTVMPYDAHGERVGRKLYFMSNEIKVKVE